MTTTYPTERFGRLLLHHSPVRWAGRPSASRQRLGFRFGAFGENIASLPPYLIGGSGTFKSHG
jgi:hypothetical protein